MRVLHCIHSLVSGGAERQLALLVKAHSSSGIETAIACINPDGYDPDELRVRIFQLPRRRPVDLNLFVHLGRTIRIFSPDVIHAWLPEVMTIPAMSMGRVHGVPTIFSYRSAMHFSRSLSFLEYATAWLCADAIASNNPISWSNCWYRLLPKVKRVAVIPNAVEVPERYVRPLKEDNRGGPRSLLFIGRLSREKNVECLLQALAILGPCYDWSLRLCGVGSLLPEIEGQLSSLGLKDRVELLGFRHDIYALMQQGDVLISPSWYEGVPNVFLEALAIGLPCLVSDIPAHREIVGSSGCAMMFDPSQPEQLASQLKDLLNNRTLRSMMVEQGRQVARRYSLSNMAESYRQLYVSLTRADQ